MMSLSTVSGLEYQAHPTVIINYEQDYVQMDSGLRYDLIYYYGGTDIGKSCVGKGGIK